MPQPLYHFIALLHVRKISQLISATQPIEVIDELIIREDTRAEALQATADHLILTLTKQLQMVIEWENHGGI